MVREVSNSYCPRRRRSSWVSDPASRSMSRWVQYPAEGLQTRVKMRQSRRAAASSSSSMPCWPANGIGQRRRDECIAACPKADLGNKVDAIGFRGQHEVRNRFEKRQTRADQRNLILFVTAAGRMPARSNRRMTPSWTSCTASYGRCMLFVETLPVYLDPEGSYGDRRSR